MDRERGNLKPAPFALTPAMVGKVVDQSPFPAKGMVHLPVERIALAEPARRSGKTARRELILAAARKLQEQKATAARARISLGVRTTKPVSLPQNPTEVRLAKLADALAWLASRGVLATVVDREALVRRYRVTGKSELLLGDDVIALAIARGMGATEAARD